MPGVELDLSKFQSGRWALQLDAVFSRRRQPAVILAQGVACLAVAWWAQLSPRSYLQSVQGALFLSPLTIGFGEDAIAAAARQGPSTRLPFPSVVASASYPFIDRLLALADSWGSQVVETGGDLTAHPTNRQATLTEDTGSLLGLLPLLQGASVGNGINPDGTIPATVLTR
ncbi:alpha/beta hydrolase [Sphingomonas sp. OK281]|uniref:alpha/beta hydrolase n=1 Tax=Sphingomonas sp. OK281 TaxID=1881067 RepID=UPI00158701DD|nr:alpha/beta hydrolase [Sphingomonas sp. OK281]